MKLVVESENITGTTFNLSYLKSLFDKYVNIYSSTTEGVFDELDCPTMIFKLDIGLDADSSTISLQNFKKFIPIENNEINKVISLVVKFVVADVDKYKERVKKIFDTANKRKVSADFRDFLKVIDVSDFSRCIYDIKDRQVSGSNFNLRDVIDLKIIKANLDDGETSLSSVFNKIVQYRLRDEDDERRISIEEEITSINEFIDINVGRSHNDVVNNVVGKVTDKKNMSVHLRADLDFKSLFSKLISYEFEENGNFIPEKQFGLGYSNLMKIIGQVIDYVEQYEESDTHNKVNLICIEEPENFMHPQMQELFIKNIDDALAVLLDSNKNKNINSQLIVTTHSSHIVNSKIHSSNTFDNINYITTCENNFSHVVTLTDNKVSGVPHSSSIDVDKLNELVFLKKHIKYKVSELFFSDAIILVEGVTEEHLLQYYINEKAEVLNMKSISIFNINGAFAHIYKPLIDLLRIPCLVITDLDIKRSEEEKGKRTPKKFKQIEALSERATTNTVLHKFICDSELVIDDDDDDEDNKSKSMILPSELDYYTEDNFKVVFQKDSIYGFFASSFEEAFILTNYDNGILNLILKELKPRIYKRIVGGEGGEKTVNLKSSSFEWQCKLSSSKSKFSSLLLYKIITSSNEKPKLPKYIEDGLNWLVSELDSRKSKVKVY